MEKAISPMTGKEKQVLIESCEITSDIKITKELKESLKMSAGKADTLIVRNIPVTILNRVNQNGRIYSTKVMQEAIENARPMFATKQSLSQSAEHPSGSFCSPTTVSHVVLDAYIKKNVTIVVEGVKEKHDVLFMDWEVVNTQEGKNLRALFEAECSIGTSIRGLGDMNGQMVENYELLGCDCVGNPSSSTFTRMPVSESVITLEAGNSKAINEAFNVTTSSTNVIRDLDQAAVMTAKLDEIGYGTVTKTSTKMESETDPKTGAETTLVTLEAETADEVTDLDQALMMAKRAILNGVTNIDSVTIENIKEEEPKEAVTDEYVPASEEAITEAKEDTVDPNEDRDYVLKAPAGFIAMEGNALSFTDDPKEAIHFKKGHEETGVVHLSSIKKILDTMGVLEVEEYFKKETDGTSEDGLNVEPTEESMDLGGTPAVNNAGTNKMHARLGEENGSNTKFSAEVVIEGPNGTSTDTVPVSATELEAATSEVANLWDMKKQGNEDSNVVVRLTDTITGNAFVYNPETQTLDPEQAEVEEATLSQKDNVVTMELDKDTSIEHTFDSPAQARVVAAGIENNTVDPAILAKEAEEETEICAICEQPCDKKLLKKEVDLGWMCPICIADVEDVLSDKLEFENAETSMDERLYSDITDPSDEYVDVALQDAKVAKLQVMLTDIDYDVDQVIAQDSIEDTIYNLPDVLEVELNDIDLPDDIDAARGAILKAANEKVADLTGAAIKDARIHDIRVIE